MNDSKSPAFQFYAADFLIGTAAMSAVEVGAYIRFLCYQWSHGGIGADLNKAAKMAGVSRTVAESVLADKFTLGADGVYRNARLERIRQSQEEFRERQRLNGARGGRPPKAGNNPGLLSGLSQTKPDGKAEPNPDESSSSSSSSSPKTERDAVALPPGFPGTIEAAISAIPVGIAYPREFIEGTWLKASGRGGRDAKDVPVRNWTNYLGSEWKFEQNRIAKEKHHANHRSTHDQGIDRGKGNLNDGQAAQYAGLG